MRPSLVGVDWQELFVPGRPITEIVLKDLADVEEARIEEDGHISVVKRDGATDPSHPQHHSPSG